MRFSLDFAGTQNVIRAYGEGWVRINDRELRHSVIVMPEQLVTDWPPRIFPELDEGHFESIKKLEPELVLLGTGGQQRFPPPHLIRPLLASGIGVEIMDTAAACRTYNIIMAEGRRVAAALLMI